MYSATFALTVIIVIALTNLFLGFASAVLLGRGPKRWSDVDRAIVLQPFPLELILPRRRQKVERIDILPGKTPVVIPVASTAPRSAGAAKATAASAKEPATVTTAANQVRPVAAAPMSASESATKRFVLSTVSPARVDDHDPPETILNRQLDAWHAGDLRDDVPSMSGITVAIRDAELESPTLSRLTNEIRTRISRQLRKDRRVLEVAANQFAWFSCDVAPGDALMPIERIRQMLCKTRFHCHGDIIHLTITAGVVTGSGVSDAADLIKRLQAAMASAREQGDSPTYLDKGQGPKPVTPFTLEVEETECDLAG